MKSILHSAVALALACGGLSLAGNARSFASSFDTTTPTPTAATATTATATPTATTTPTTILPTTPTTTPAPRGLIASLSAPKPGIRISRSPLTYQIKAGKPVTWWFAVADPDSLFVYGVNVFRGTDYAHPVAASATLSSYHQRPRVTGSWTWNTPSRGTYTVCAVIAGFNGDRVSCQLVRVI